MHKRDYGFLLSLIVIIAIAVFLVIDKIQEYDLEHYLTVIGKQFLELVPEGKNRTLLAERYNEFLQRVQNKEVSPDQVEQIAVRILNYASVDSAISEEQALAMFDLSKAYPKEFSASVNMPQPNKNKNFNYASDSITKAEIQKENAQNYEAVSKRLKQVMELQKELKKSKLLNLNTKNFTVRYNGRIKVEINPEIISEIQSKQDSKLLKEINKLHSEDILVLKNEINKQVQESMIEINETLKSLDSIKTLKFEIDSISNNN